MKSGRRDNMEGNYHQVKGRIKEIAGKIIVNPDLEGEGKGENRIGRLQEKVGDVKKVVGR